MVGRKKQHVVPVLSLSQKNQTVHLPILPAVEFCLEYMNLKLKFMESSGFDKRLCMLSEFIIPKKKSRLLVGILIAIFSVLCP